MSSFNLRHFFFIIWEKLFFNGWLVPEENQDNVINVSKT